MGHSVAFGQTTPNASPRIVREGLWSELMEKGQKLVPRRGVLWRSPGVFWRCGPRAVRPLTPDPSPTVGRGERCRRIRRDHAARPVKAAFLRVKPPFGAPRTAQGHPSPLVGEGPGVRGRAASGAHQRIRSNQHYRNRMKTKPTAVGFYITQAEVTTSLVRSRYPWQTLRCGCRRA
jgi:hypothetical protein